MRILDRYVFKSALTIFITCIFIFLFLYCIIDILAHLEDILKQKVSFMLLLQYYASYIPIMFVQVAPFACLLSTLYTFGGLNHNNEIIAMRSSGMSIFQLSKTVIILGLIISAFIFWLNDRVNPHASALNQRLRDQIEQGKKPKDKQSEVIKNLSMYGLKNRLFFIAKFHVATNTMERITILEHDEHQNITRKIVANKGLYKDGLWRFYQSITYNFDQNGQILQEPEYMDEEIMAIPETPQDFINQRQRTEYMNITELQDYMWKLSRSGATSIIRNLKVDLYQRYTTPLTSFVIILLGIPFSLIMRRRATGLSSIGVSILVGFIYYILDAICIALGKGGILMPFLSTTLSHIIAFIFALYMISVLP